jgi:hypothetical protein
LLLHLKAASYVREQFIDGNVLLLVILEEIIDGRVVLL